MSAQSDEYVEYATSGSGKNDPIPVTKDEDIEPETTAEDPNPEATLQQDEKEAIDQSNVINERTRGAGPSGGYKDPEDEEDLPTQDGTSSTA